MTGMEGVGGSGRFSAPSPQPTSQDEISDSPLWHLFDYDLIDQTFTLIRIKEQTYREASFLDNRIDSYKLPMVRYEMQHLNQVFPPLGETRHPPAWIFHIGHCGSTLLSRALSASKKILPVREPMSLRTLSADRHVLNTPMSMLSGDHWNSLLSTLVDSLSRRFHTGQTNVVKATSTSNNLIAPVLEQDARHKAVLLYIPLESYLATMLGKPRQASDLWVQAKKRMTDWMAIDCASRIEIHELQAHQLATLSWLTCMNYMLAARENFGDRVLMLNFEALISNPNLNLEKVASFFGSEGEAETIIKQFPHIASAYSKQPNQKYTPQTRAKMLERTRNDHSRDIRSGIEWARRHISKNTVLAGCENFLD